MVMEVVVFGAGAVGLGIAVPRNETVYHLIKFIEGWKGRATE
jgi:ketopantoate reductase